MLVCIDPAIRADHDVVRRLVLDGFEGVDGSYIEVLVERARRRQDSFTGRAYSRPPRSLVVGADTRYLVRIRVPGTLRNRGYPMTQRYPRRKTAPWITVSTWRERLVSLAAHEACHVRQFREGLRRSEVEAERWALRVLEGWVRGQHSVAREAPGEPRSQQLALFAAV